MHIQFFLVLWKGVWCPCLQRRHDYHYGGISEAETYNCKTQGVLLEDQWCGLNKNYPAKAHVWTHGHQLVPSFWEAGTYWDRCITGASSEVKGLAPLPPLRSVSCQSGLVLYCCAFAAMVDCNPSEPWAKLNAFSSFYRGLNQANRKVTSIICILLCP